MDGGEFSVDETTEMLFEKRRCCFCIPCLPSSNQSPSAAGGSNWWQRIRTKSVVDDTSLWSRGVTALKKLREWSEIVAGPRWKTFIRRFNRSRSRGGGSRNVKFQYDPLSYALNFDDGPAQDGNSEEENEYRFRNFSSRYASIPASAKTSMDLGMDGASFV